MRVARVVTSVVFLLILVAVVSACIQAKLPSSKLQGYADIFQLIEERSIHDLTKDDLIKIHECILEKAFLRSEVAESRFLLKNCFEQDHFADYYTPAQVKVMRMRRQGSFFDIGVNMILDENGAGLIITGFVEKGPAEKEDILQKGDKIIAAGEDEDSLKEFKGLLMVDMLNLLRSSHNGRIFLKIIRGSQIIIVSAGLGKAVFVKTESSILEPGLGYLKIKSFEHRNLVPVEVKPILKHFVDKGVRGLILDLRDNPGGEVRAVKEFLDLFTPAANLLMFESRGRPGSKEETDSYFSSERGPYADYKIAILVNSNSASAAEIAAGVLRLWGHKLIGVKTYGKGSVQSLINLSDGGIFKFTIAKYYFSDNSIPDKQGIVPDVIVEDSGVQLKEAIEYLRLQLQINSVVP